jgi:hypothetical protein
MASLYKAIPRTTFQITAFLSVNKAALSASSMSPLMPVFNSLKSSLDHRIDMSNWRFGCHFFPSYRTPGEAANSPRSSFHTRYSAA